MFTINKEEKRVLITFFNSIYIFIDLLAIIFYFLNLYFMRQQKEQILWKKRKTEKIILLTCRRYTQVEQNNRRAIEKLNE